MTDDDLIPRLRAVFGGGTWGSPAVRLCHAAADALEAAKRENEGLRKALRDTEQYIGKGHHEMAFNIARAALSGERREGEG